MLIKLNKKLSFFWRYALHFDVDTEKIFNSYIRIFQNATINFYVMFPQTYML